MSDPAQTSYDRAFWPADHPVLPDRKIGIVIMNLGTPDATDYWSMRRYLKEFLSDRRVIEANPFLWKILLNTIILTTRPFRSGKAYDLIWNREKDESPLRTITRSQSDKLAVAMADWGRHLVVDWAMRYGQPSVASVMAKLQAQGCDRLLLFPLYPQYSAPTMATAYDKAFDALKTMRWQPAVRTVPPYHEHPVYIEALAESVGTHLAVLDWQPEVVLTSFHGLPRMYLEKGDPYHCQCAKTARLLRDKLGWSEDRMRLTFQSRFGPDEWLQPYTDKTVESLAKEGVRKLAIVTPGFSADCVETLEEINGEVREIFLEHGGEYFTFIPCLNDSKQGMRVIETVVESELRGWVG